VAGPGGAPVPCAGKPGRTGLATRSVPFNPRLQARTPPSPWGGACCPGSRCRIADFSRLPGDINRQGQSRGVFATSHPARRPSRTARGCGGDLQAIHAVGGGGGDVRTGKGRLRPHRGVQNRLRRRLLAERSRIHESCGCRGGQAWESHTIHAIRETVFHTTPFVPSGGRVRAV
jgi:hypothetical protein